MALETCNVLPFYSTRGALRGHQGVQSDPVGGEGRTIERKEEAFHCLFGILPIILSSDALSQIPRHLRLLIVNLSFHRHTRPPSLFFSQGHLSKLMKEETEASYDRSQY